MKRRSCILRSIGAWMVVAISALLAPPVAAQVPVVGVLLFEPWPSGSTPFAPELKELGQREGKTYVLEFRHAAGDNTRFPALARELLDRKPAVIVTSCGPPLRAIRKLDSRVPVIAGCADPKNFYDEVERLSRPGRRTTGFTFLAPESASKRLQILKELSPGLRGVGVLHHQHDDWSTYFDEMERAARPLGLTLSRLPIARAEDIEGVLGGAVRQGVRAIVVLPDAITIGARARIAALAIQHRVPSVFDTSFFVADGGLLSYGPDWAEFAPRINASYIDKILRGIDPGDLPIQQPTRLELVVNLRTASAIGISIPRSLLLRADRVIN